MIYVSATVSCIPFGKTRNGFHVHARVGVSITRERCGLDVNERHAPDTFREFRFGAIRVGTPADRKMVSLADGRSGLLHFFESGESGRRRSKPSGPVLGSFFLEQV